MTQAEVNACGNEAGWVAKVMADAIMDYDVAGVPLRDQEIDGVGKLHLPTLGECPFLCVRGLGLQVIRESVGVSHG